MKGLPCTMNSPWMEDMERHSWYFRPLVQRFLANTTVHVSEDCSTCPVWSRYLSWCSYLEGNLILKRPLPEERDSGWSVLPSPCVVSPPGCTQQVRLSFTYSDKSVTQICPLFTQEVLNHKLLSPQNEWSPGLLEKERRRQKSFLFVKLTPVIFSSKSSNVVISCPSFKKVLPTSHQAYSQEHWLELEWSSCSRLCVTMWVCHNVSVSLFVLRVCFLSPPPFYLYFFS